MRVILHDIDPDDFILAARAVRWLMARPQQREAIIAYGDEPARNFYVRRNAASITVKPC